MSRFGEIRLDWGGEPDRVLRLGIGEIGRLQEKVNAGPLGVAARCQVSLAALHFQAHKDWVSLSQLDLSKLAERPMVREVFLQALLGVEGQSRQGAEKLVREWVDERPLGENLVFAIAICNASVYGVEDEDAAGESEAAAAASHLSTTESSASARTVSTASGPPATSVSKTSTL